MGLKTMRSKIIFLIAVLSASAVLLLANATSHEMPGRITGGNFSEERNCTACHAGVVNSGTGSVGVMINGTPLSQYRYTPGEQVAVAVRIAEAGKKSFGFQATARQPDGCVQAGIFNSDETTVEVKRDQRTPEGCSGSTVLFPTHTNAAIADGEATFEFQWTAPPADIGPIRWAAAGNAANGDNTPDGDSTYTMEVTTAAASSTVVNPSINAGGVVLATGTPSVTQLSPGAIATVYGQHFAPEGTDVRQPFVDEQGWVWDKLADTCVEVNEKRASLFAIFSGQINFQIPADVGLGMTSIRVVRSCNTEQEKKTDAEMITVVDAAPAFFNFTNAVDGNNPIAAQRSDYSLLAAEGMFGGGTSSSPAEPGEVVHLYASGFGGTTPEVPTGHIPVATVPNGQAEVVNRANVRITVGGMDVPADEIYYVGVSPCCAGLFQATFSVPGGLPDGTHQVVITINGVASPAGPYIVVRKN